MRNFGLAIAVFAMSFTISSIAFVQTNKSNNTKPTNQKPQQTRQANAKQQQVRCPVSGKVITNTKNAPRTVYQGKTYYFSCQNCLAEFRKNPQKYVNQANVRTVSNTAAKPAAAKSCCSGEAKAAGAACCAGDKATAQKTGSCCDSKPAVTTAQAADRLVCPVSGEELKAETAVQVVYNNKVYYVGCEGCKAAFLKDPATYAKKAEAESKQQGKPVKATTTAAPADKLICPVAGEEIQLASAVSFTYNGKVYYTCCNGCKSKFLRDPETYAKKAEELSALQGKPAKADTN
ncbi:MAG: YHS domain-containing protein [Fimbriimonadales bacterium]|nr:YHS domain-containing protein [Fimbriimonadales bacterium]